ncbi:MAG: hypothetical protein QOG46_2635, partial [Pseudonocardiales bacterium]|nr:hypothetical protein [Pseudonocardiales bacterium]
MSEPNATARLASLAAGMPTAEVPEVAR